MRHLSDQHPGPADLIAWASGRALDEVATHVANCQRCQHAARDWHIVGLRAGEALREEADEVFTAGRLAQQRASIFRRLRQGGPARVLPFPARPAALAGRSGLFRTEARRWIAAAAVVGLVVGTLAGRFLLDPRPRTPAHAAAGVAPRALTPPAAPRFPTATTSSDEAFLVELDAAVFSSSPRALRAIDALTPDTER